MGRSGVWAGVDSGVTMRLQGQGMPGPQGVEGAQPGDLLVDLDVQPSPVFERHGADLSMHAPVDFTDAILGGYVKCALCLPLGSFHPLPWSMRRAAAFTQIGKFGLRCVGLS